jgi:RNA 2',3'-cyclic 3'-phosphodiesterase
VSEGRARIFVVLDLPAAVRGELAAWAAQAVGGEEGIRVLDEESLHVTLCFLGWRALDEAHRIAELWLPCATRAPQLATGGAAWLPPRRPGVLVVDLEDEAGTLAEMQRCVAEALAAGIGHEPETRPFRPHVTVARVRRGTRRPAGDLPSPPRIAFAGEALTLYRSQLRREGARYQALARVAL